MGAGEAEAAIRGLDWSGPPIAVVGIGPGGRVSDPAALDALAEAEAVIGSDRQMDALRILYSRRVPLPRPLADLWPLLEDLKGRQIAILASGDPLCFGIGGSLRDRLPAEALRFYPNVSSLQAAFARIGEPWQRARWVSLHGRPLNALERHLGDGRWLGLLTDKRNTPTAIAGYLSAVGFGESACWVAEDLDGPAERMRLWPQARELADEDSDFHALNVMVVQIRGRHHPLTAGLPDTAFATDGEPGQGLITKRMVRAAVLALMAPQPGETAWDVGAGCGSVAVEWARLNRDGQVFAIERHPARLDCLQVNRQRFAVTANLHPLAGQAPDALADLPAPHAVFVGGGGADLPAILAACWSRLRPGGRLVAAAVTEPSRAALHAFAANHAEAPVFHEIAVRSGDALAGQTVLRPHLPVLLLAATRQDP